MKVPRLNDQNNYILRRFSTAFKHYKTNYNNANRHERTLGEVKSCNKKKLSRRFVASVCNEITTFTAHMHDRIVESISRKAGGKRKV